MTDPPADEDRLRRRVEDCGDGAHVRVPAEWLGEDVVVAKADTVAVPGSTATEGDPVVDDPDDPGYDVVAGPPVREQLEAAAVTPRTAYLGYVTHEAGVRHVGVPRASLADGLLVAGRPATGKTSLLGSLAWQAAAGGAGVAAVSRDGDVAERFAASLPDDRHEDLAVVGGPEARTVNLLDAGVPRSSPDFFEAVDAATDGLVSMTDLLSPQLRNAIKEYVMVAQGPEVTPSLTDVADLVRSGYDDGTGGPQWAHDASPDLSNRVAGVDEMALDLFLESLAPLLDDPVRRFLDDPDPDHSLVSVVAENRPLAVSLPPDTVGESTWPWVARAVTHGLWAGARELVGPGAESPFYLVGDDFGPALDVGPDVTRLFGRARKARFTLAVSVDGPSTVDAETWEGLADAGAAALFEPVDGDAETVAEDRALDEADLGELGPHEFWLDGPETLRRATAYPPLPPRREPTDTPWL